MKRLWNLALTLALTVALACALGTLTAQAAESDFVIDENGVLTSYSGPGGDVVIPDGVTTIGYGVFNKCTSLTSITIPHSVTEIGMCAFQDCSSLTSVTIGNSVTSIGFGAFSGCSGLTSAGPIGGGYDYEFGWTDQIPSSAFHGCSGLTSVTIPDSVTSIGWNAFADCASLLRIDVAAGNTKYCVEDGVLFSKDKTVLIAYPGGKEGTSYTIPDGVISINNTAFRGCDRLTSVTIPDGVTYIRDSAFWECASLASINIPKSVTTIDNFAFGHCTGLASITIPEGVISIGHYAFRDCTGLTSITIPNTVTSIGDHAFWYCTGLTSVTIPESVTYIGDNAFNNCTGLTDVYYSGSEADWKAIGDKADVPTSATIHYGATTKATYTLTGDDSALSFSHSDHGRLSLAQGELAPEEKVLVACFDDSGRFTGVKLITADRRSASIGNSSSFKLFWVGGTLAPKCQAVTVEN